MSKRTTTGLPKVGATKASKPDAASEQPKGILQQRLLREYHTKHEREVAVQRLVILGVVAAGALIAVILVLAFIVDQFIRPAQTVAVVNGTSITVGDFTARTRLERALLGEQINEGIALYSGFGLESDQIVQQISSQAPYSEWLNELSVPDQLGNRVLGDMVEDVLIRQQADELGIAVTDEDVQREINEYFAYDPNAGVVDPTATPSPTLTPTPIVSPTPSPIPTETLVPTATIEATVDALAPTQLPTTTPAFTSTPAATPTPSATPSVEERQQQFQDQRSSFYSRVTSSAGVSEATIIAYFTQRALRQKVREAVLGENEAMGTFVNARHILVASQEEAQRVVDALAAGESFAALAALFSTDGSAQNGGELGWSQPDRYVEEFADAVTTGAVGAILGPVQTQFGFHVIQVTGREQRAVTDAEADTQQSIAFSTYLDDLRAADTTQVEINDIWADNVPSEPVFVPRGL
ncbi:MAG: peptidylprolyl isomerase [Chloroflexota bacterium]|nr:peptidylprolyl isomerase [Chloroflexota bacterium]